jgi:hypothetical protein
MRSSRDRGSPDILYEVLRKYEIRRNVEILSLPCPRSVVMVSQTQTRGTLEN